MLDIQLCLQGLGLVFVAVYQRALKLLYVDELLERVKREFAQQYKPDQVFIMGCSGLPALDILRVCCMQFKYKSFEDSFRQMLKDAENSTDISKHSAQALSSTKVMTVFMLCSYLQDAFCMQNNII